MSQPGAPESSGMSSKIGGAAGIIGIACVATAVTATTLVYKKANEIESKQAIADVRLGNLGKAVASLPSADSINKLMEVIAEQSKQIQILGIKVNKMTEENEMLKITVNLMAKQMREEGKLQGMDGLVMLQESRSNSSAMSSRQRVPEMASSVRVGATSGVDNKSSTSS